MRVYIWRAKDPTSDTGETIVIVSTTNKARSFEFVRAHQRKLNRPELVFECPDGAAAAHIIYSNLEERT